MNDHCQTLGDSVDGTNPYSMQPTGYLVRLVVELTAGVELGHDDLGSTHLLLRVLADRNPSTVVNYCH